ncbi:MAG TPA: universal stress protein [Rhodocyclaceae bacterium]|nr:universal stress protein [Rhodocyclaceae bacterium]
MSYKTILVHSDAGKHWPARLDLAVQLARQHDAHLLGLHAPNSAALSGFMLSGLDPALAESLARLRAEQAAQAQASFNKAVSAAGINNAEWRLGGEDAVATVLTNARYVDLLILGQRDPAETDGVDSDFAEQVVLAAGRPVLMLPYAGRFGALGRQALVAWDASREAARAISDALPLLRQADNVKLITINPKGDRHGELPGADVGLYLARHGVRIEVVSDCCDNIGIGNELLSRAADFGSDLIVMGAYGHPRLKELVMGGATRTILDSMTVPVLLSH